MGKKIEIINLDINTSDLISKTKDNTEFEIKEVKKYNFKFSIDKKEYQIKSIKKDKRIEDLISEDFQRLLSLHLDNGSTIDSESEVKIIFSESSYSVLKLKDVLKGNFEITF